MVIHGWGRRSSQPIITAEAVKARASEEVQSQYVKADELRQEAQELELRIKTLQNEITDAFQEREDQVQQKEKAIENLQRMADEKASEVSVSENKLEKVKLELDDLRERLDRRASEMEQANKLTVAQLQKDRQDLIRDGEVLKLRTSDAKIKLGEAEILKSQLADERQIFEAEVDDWNKKSKDLSFREEDLKTNLSVLETSRALLEESKKAHELDKEKLELTRRETQDEISQLEDKRKKHAEREALLKVTQDQIDLANQNLVDEKNKLNIFKQTLDQKQRELQVRDNNLKQLEAQNAVRT